VDGEHRGHAGGWAPTAFRIARTTSLSGIVVSISQSATARSSGSTSRRSAWKPAELLGRLTERVVQPLRQPSREDVYRRAQQDDVIELGVELHLILFASGYEQYVGVLSGQQSLDGVLTPLLAAIRLRLAPSGIGVYRLVAQRGELGDQARFPRT
jgi:hypothetical protein